MTVYYTAYIIVGYRFFKIVRNQQNLNLWNNTAVLAYTLWNCYCYVCNVSSKAKGCDYVTQLPSC